MKQLEQTWRWFGPDDPVNLRDIKQAGATGIVTALHHISNGEVWTKAAIQERKHLIESEGLRWSVVESLPVSEAIKKRTGDYLKHIENYRQSLQNLGECGILVVTYNFMPIVDWTRTRLDYPMVDGSTGLQFDQTALRVFDWLLLERPAAARDYTDAQKYAAKALEKKFTAQEKQTLIQTIIAGLPGAEEGYTLEQFRAALATYKEIDADSLRNHLILFLNSVAPIAEAAGIKLALHPDDPPFSIFGLPRVVCNQQDVEAILEAVPNPANGLCFCTGSFGAHPENDLPNMVRKFADRIHFVHLRNVKKSKDGSFYEADHLAGDVDMYAMMQALCEEQQKRINPIPMRPDHGHKMLDDLTKETNPGYSAIGRLRGLAELRGMEICHFTSSKWKYKSLK